MLPPLSHLSSSSFRSCVRVLVLVHVEQSTECGQSSAPHRIPDKHRSHAVGAWSRHQTSFTQRARLPLRAVWLQAGISARSLHRRGPGLHCHSGDEEVLGSAAGVRGKGAEKAMRKSCKRGVGFSPLGAILIDRLGKI